MVQQGEQRGTGRRGLIRALHSAAIAEDVAGFAVYETPDVPRPGNKYPLFGGDAAISYVAPLNEIKVLRLQTTFANAARRRLLNDILVVADFSHGGVQPTTLALCFTATFFASCLAATVRREDSWPLVCRRVECRLL